MSLKLSFFRQGIVLKKAVCITTFLRSMVAKCESNENGRFSADFQPSLVSLNCMKLSLKVKSKMSFISERQSYFKEKAGSR